jgi:membrane protease YdiL (CAAX protease family)
MAQGQRFRRACSCSGLNPARTGFDRPLGHNLKLGVQPLPLTRVVAYSVGILAVFLVGTVLESRFRFTGIGEALGAIPVLVCAVFVCRLPQPATITVSWGWRLLLLGLPLVLLPLADFKFPEFAASQAAVWMVVIVQAFGIGVSEEVTFRFALHRLWSHFGALFYVFASSTVFGVLHFPLGLQVSIISAIIGAIFAASRVAGMPLVPLIIFHAFLDVPMVYRVMSVN